MCGEKGWVSDELPCRYGSPPRVRGEGDGGRYDMKPIRITPACAGRSTPRARINACRSDHPRVCGEKGSVASMECSLLGSPPRVRGEAEGAGLTAPAGRITPACAGRSVLRRRMCPETEDHPRVCGEKEEGEV